MGSNRKSRQHEEQMGNVSKEIEILKKKKTEMPEIKNTVTEMKAFDVLISRLDKAEERISELGAMSTETPKLKSKERKRLKKSRTEYPRTVGQLQSIPTCNVIGIPEGEEKKEQKKYLKQ